MPNAVARPWRMFLPLGIVLFLALLWSAYWFVASGVAKDRLAAERTRLAAQGLTLTCSNERWGGYPFRFEFDCAAPSLSKDGRIEVTSARLLLVALAYAPWQVAALIDGPSTVSGRNFEPIDLRHQRALAAVTLHTAGKPSFSAELPVVSVADFGKAAKLSLFTRPSASGGTDIAVQGTKLSYEPAGKPPLMVDDASLQGTLEPDHAFHVEKIEASHGELRYWGTGRVALDDQRRLAGQVDTKTNDVKALLAVAGPYLGLSDGKLANLRTMLGLLGSGAEAPIIAKDGALFIGPFQIAELKPLY